MRALRDKYILYNYWLPLQPPGPILVGRQYNGDYTVNKYKGMVMSNGQRGFTAARCRPLSEQYDARPGSQLSSASWPTDPRRRRRYKGSGKLELDAKGACAGHERNETRTRESAINKRENKQY